jgi:hypothetical protein
MRKGTIILNRDGKIKGTVRGDGRPCRQVEGCCGRQVPVRWSDGKLTWPCTEGMEQTKVGWQIR